MANITVSDLYIGGVKMPDPALEGMTISREKIWSANTGRTASGKMVGTIVAIKTTVKIKWPPLTPAQVRTIESAVSNAGKAFTTLKYTDMTGNTVTKTVYFGTPTYTVYSWAAGKQYIRDVSVDGVEQ